MSKRERDTCKGDVQRFLSLSLSSKPPSMPLSLILLRSFFILLKNPPPLPYAQAANPADHISVVPLPQPLPFLPFHPLSSLTSLVPPFTSFSLVAILIPYPPLCRQGPPILPPIFSNLRFFLGLLPNTFVFYTILVCFV